MAAEIKVEKDIEDVRALIKEIDSIQGEVNKINSAWNAYEKSIPSKNIGEDVLGGLLKELLKKEYRNIKSSETYIENRIGENSLKKAIFINNTNTTTTDKYLSESDIHKFTKTVKELYDKINDLQSKEQPNSERAKKYTTVLDNLKKDTGQTPSVETLLKQTSNADSTTAYQNREKIVNFINATKEMYDNGAKDGEYTPLEKKNIATYFSENKVDGFFKSIKENETLIATKVNAVISKLTEIATKFSGLDTRIKKNVLEQLRPKDVAAENNFDIVKIVTDIVAKFIEDFKIHSTIRAVSGGGRRKKQTGGEKVDREPINQLFTKATQSIKKLKDTAAELYKGLNRFSNPEMGDASKGEDSIFNRLFEKYMDTKENGGDFIASTKLIDDLKSNDLYPEEVLTIDMRDKFIFVAVTLFMRIISLIIIEIIIDRKLITRMDSAIFWYGITMTLFIIVFVILVNYDSYKLRILFNYVNFHIGYSTTFSYVSQLWLFGGMVYYIMLNINDGIITPATNDEDRARLKHKVQVVSMITWFFLALGVLVM